MRAAMGNLRRAYRREPPARRFSKQWFKQTIHTFIWVVIITVLIWVYADIQFTDQKEISARLRLRVDMSEGMVLLSAEEIPVVFRVKGNRHYINRFSDLLAAKGSVLEYDVARAKEFTAGVYYDRTDEILSSLPEFRNSGLEIVSARPGRIKIRLDKLVLIRDVPVRFNYTGAELEGKVVINPDRVSLHVPASERRRINPSKIVLSTRLMDLSNTPAGKVNVVDMEVLPPAGVEHAVIAPPKVSITFKVRQQTGKKHFTVAVSYQAPSSWLTDGTWEKYRLEVKPTETWTREIVVAGSRVDLEKLTPEKINAYIVLTDEDKKRDWWPGKIHVEFPKDLNVRLAKPVPDLLYRLIKRPGTTGQTGG